MTAQEKYQETANEIKRTLAAIDQLLQQHAQAASRNPRNWGYTGDLGEVLSQLNETYEFLSNND